MKMKRERMIYWISTAIIAVLMFFSAINFAFNEDYKDAFKQLNLPNWFKTELTIAKFLGALALLIPIVPKKIKEFAYFGFALTLISADIAHLSTGDSAWVILPHFAFFCILGISYVYYHKINDPKR